MIRRPPRSTLDRSSAASDVYKRQAHERVLYDQLKKASKDKPVATQRSMFPSTLELTPADAAVMEEIITDLQQLGYSIEPFGKNTYVIQGTPADVEAGNEKHIIDILLEQYKHLSLIHISEPTRPY